MLYTDSSILTRMARPSGFTAQIAPSGELSPQVSFIGDANYAPKNLLTQPFDGPLTNPMGLSGLHGGGLGAFDLSTFSSSFGGSAVGFASIAALLLIWQAFFGPGAKEERGKRKLAKEDARHTSSVATIKARYGL